MPCQHQHQPDLGASAAPGQPRGARDGAEPPVGAGTDPTGAAWPTASCGHSTAAGHVQERRAGMGLGVPASSHPPRPRTTRAAMGAAGPCGPPASGACGVGDTAEPAPLGEGAGGPGMAMPRGELRVGRGRAGGGSSAGLPVPEQPGSSLGVQWGALPHGPSQGGCPAPPAPLGCEQGLGWWAWARVVGRAWGSGAGWGGGCEMGRCTGDGAVGAAWVGGHRMGR